MPEGVDDALVFSSRVGPFVLPLATLTEEQVAQIVAKVGASRPPTTVS